MRKGFLGFKKWWGFEMGLKTGGFEKWRVGFKRKGFRDRLRWASRDILGVCVLYV